MMFRIKSWTIHSLLVILLAAVNNTGASAKQQTQATIPALDQQSIYIYADSDSFITILEYYYHTPAVLNISHVEFQTGISSTNTTATTTPTSSTTTIPQYLHLVLLHLPPDCIKDDTTRCDLLHLGVGLETSDGSEKKKEWCCTVERQQQGHCEHLSKLIINQTIFQGQEHALLIPQTIDTIFAVGSQAGIFDIPQKGEYALLLANCKDGGLDLYSVLSSDQQERNTQLHLLEAFQDYYICLTFYHFFLFLAYVFAVMVIISDDDDDSTGRIRSMIQKWLGVTMAIAAMDTLFQCINYSSMIWDDHPASWFNVFTVSVAMGVFKRGISMSVGVMVAKGWGRVRKSHGGELVVICLFGFLYTGIVFFHEISNALLETNLKNEIMVQGGDMTDMGLIFAVIIFVMDIIFIVWILSSVRSTIVYLKSTGVGRQQQCEEQVSHHRVLGGLLTFSMIAMAPAWIIQFCDRFQEPKLLTQDQWNYMNATVQGIYTITLTGVAALWIPKQSSLSRELRQENYCTEMKELRGGNNHTYNNNGDTHGDAEDEIHHLWNDYNDGSGGDGDPFKDDDAGENDDNDDGNDPDHRNGLLVNSGQLS